MKTMQKISALLLAFLLSASLTTLGSCGTKNHIEYTKPVSLSIIVVDENGAAWDGMEVHLLEAWNEWSDDYREGKDPWATLDTDERGRVYFDSEAISAAELGFFEDPAGIATLSSHLHRNEAEFTIEVGHPTLGWIEVQLPMHYKHTHLDVEIEFEAEFARESRR